MYIGFRYYNEKGGYTPYGRGKDIEGGDKVYFSNKDNGISIDQYGKGNVLYKDNGEILIGKVNSRSLM